MSVSQGKVVRDGRRLPFVIVTKAATARLAEVFEGRSLAIARSVYLGVVEAANRERSDTFTAFRAELAAVCGVSPRTLTEYADRLEAAGLLAVERRQQDGVNLPNVWTLTDPPEGGAAAAGVAQQPQEGRAGAAGGVAQQPQPMKERVEELKEPSSFGGGAAPAPAREPARGEQASLLPEPPPAREVVQGEVEVWPDGFPAELQPVARDVHAVLMRTAGARKGAKIPKLEAVAAAMRSAPRRPFLDVALRVEFWLTQGRGANKPARDLVQRYATWLREEDEVSDGSRPAPVGVQRHPGSRSAAVDATMQVLEGYSDPSAPRWE